MQALVIDDSRATRRIVGQYLKDLSFEVLEAGDGQQALDTLVEHGLPDVVMVDQGNWRHRCWSQAQGRPGVQGSADHHVDDRNGNGTDGIGILGWR